MTAKRRPAILAYFCGGVFGLLVWVAASGSLALGLAVGVAAIVLLGGVSVIEDDFRHDQVMERLERLSDRLYEVETRLESIEESVWSIDQELADAMSDDEEADGDEIPF